MGCNCTKSHQPDCQRQPPGESLSPSAQPHYSGEDTTPRCGSALVPEEEGPLDVPSDAVPPAPSLLQVKSLPRKVSLVQQTDETKVIEVCVEELAQALSKQCDVTPEQALEALQWSNFDPEEAAALLLQTTEIEEYAAEVEQPRGTSPPPFWRKRNKLLTLLQNKAAATAAVNHPTRLIASIARIVLDQEQHKTSSAVESNRSRKRPLRYDECSTQQPNQITSTSPSTDEGGNKRRSLLPHDEGLTPQSRRLAYFAAKYDVKKSMSEGVSSPGVTTHGGTPGCLTNSMSPSNMGDVIMESSKMGHYIMPPWEEDDPDVRNNFWCELPAHKSILSDQTFLTEGIHYKVNQDGKVVAEEISPDGSEPSGLASVTPRRSSLSQADLLPYDSLDNSYGIKSYRMESVTVTDGQHSHVPQISAVNDPCGATLQGVCTSSEDAVSLQPNIVDGWNQLGDDKWTDPGGRIALSEKQLRKIHQWKRITELSVPYPSSKDGQGRKETSASSVIIGPNGLPLKPGDPLHPVLLIDRPRARAIRQGFVGDCSFLSSLASLAEYEGRLKTPVITSIIYPQVFIRGEKGQPKVEPVINENGMYACKLHFNGASRKVLVDDFVPVRKDGKLLAAHSANKREMWVTILEKAFVKLMGGSYFMHGSNPGADLYHLTGWIPETIPFRKDVHTGSPAFFSPVVTGGEESLQLCRDPRWDLVWKQLYTGFSRGRCVACLGTSEVADAAPSGLDFLEGVSISSGIVARHAYSVLSCREIMGRRLLYVRNPWACVRWKGKYGPGDAAWTPELAQACHYDYRGALKADNGSFWIEWRDVVRWFSHLYLCWNSHFFLYEYTVHSRWGASPHPHTSLLMDDSHNVAYNPQFHLRVAPIILDSSSIGNQENDVADIWILLSRHVRDRKKDLFQKYIAIHVYASDKRLCCPIAAVQQGVYSNGECTLLRIRVRRPRVYSHTLGAEALMEWKELAKQHSHSDGAGLGPPPGATQPQIIDPSCVGGLPPIIEEKDLMLVVSQYSQKGTFNFTLKLHGSVPMKLVEIPPLVPSKEWTTLSQMGEWTAATAGGCSNDLWTYFRNPHYRLSVPKHCVARVFLECPTELSINVRILRSPFSSARLLRTKKALSSGPYRVACCYLEVELFPGTHTLIPSSFRAGDTGQFQLRVHLSIPPSEAALVPSLDEQIMQLNDHTVLPDGTVVSNQPNQHTPRVLEALCLEPLPSPHVFPPAPPFQYASLSGGSVSGVNKAFFGLFAIQSEAVHCSVAIKLETFYPESATTPQATLRSSFPSISVLFMMSPSHPWASPTAPASAEYWQPFNPALIPIPSPFKDPSLVKIVKRSDLEGGLSRSGNRPSTAAAQLYTRQGVLYLSHVQLFHSSVARGSYYIMVSTTPQQGVLKSYSCDGDASVSPVPLSPCVEYGSSFRLHVISDQRLSVAPL
eukprot:Blabericola_migrator_1__13315@NODE_935_length_5982_cov_124_245309_g650_i0_p1_GENE_NODE_935_length_5982_cov_124_245309_g650_i0NODE_935_length_5982_cov_124_245309_g650_i0_p1_ORF_typecomplete_len1432_score233_59Peptidase_C2/PF00648_21/9_7e70Calpain_III/PF01067_22/0_76Calpain_III/PF01067_22/2_6e14Calpain_III/PF01067_22/7_1e03_NODE_935_length_5982_cov_124_245309_g650_i04214716